MNEWRHYAVTYDGTEVVFYDGGLQVNSSSAPTPPVNSHTNASIAFADWYGSWVSLWACVDDVSLLSYLDALCVYVCVCVCEGVCVRVCEGVCVRVSVCERERGGMGGWRKIDFR